MSEKERKLLMKEAVESYKNFGSANEAVVQKLLKAGVCDGERGKLIKNIAFLASH